MQQIDSLRNTQDCTIKPLKCSNIMCTHFPDQTFMDTFFYHNNKNIYLLSPATKNQHLSCLCDFISAETHWRPFESRSAEGTLESGCCAWEVDPRPCRQACSSPPYKQQTPPGLFKAALPSVLGPSYSSSHWFPVQSICGRDRLTRICLPERN